MNHWSAVHAKGWAGKAVPVDSVQLHPHPSQELGRQTPSCLCIHSCAMPLQISLNSDLTALPCSSFREMDYYRRAAHDTQIQNSSKIIKIPQSLTVAFIFMKLKIGGAKKNRAEFTNRTVWLKLSIKIQEWKKKNALFIWTKSYHADITAIAPTPSTPVWLEHPSEMILLIPLSSGITSATCRVAIPKQYPIRF